MRNGMIAVQKFDLAELLKSQGLEFGETATEEFKGMVLFKVVGEKIGPTAADAMKFIRSSDLMTMEFLRTTGLAFTKEVKETVVVRKASAKPAAPKKARAKKVKAPPVEIPDGPSCGEG